MSYYPTNFYSNYLYGQQYPQYPNNSTIAQNPLQSTSMIQSGLQGKIVENAEVVKITDIPFGGYGIFPKTDMSEIYVKTWNNNGTTNITTYTPVISSQEDDKENEINHHELILNKIDELENKIDNIIANTNISISSKDRKEIDVNAY